MIDGVKAILKNREFKVTTGHMTSLFKSLRNLKYTKSEDVLTLLVDKVNNKL